MAVKSQARRRNLAQLLIEGKISNETFEANEIAEEWNRQTGANSLSERVAPKRKRTPKATARKTPQTTTRKAAKKR
jgi:hypothetical protein